jgi:hypothetical protein
MTLPRNVPVSRTEMSRPLPWNTGILGLFLEGYEIKVSFWNKESMKVAALALNLFAERFGVKVSVVEIEEKQTGCTHGTTNGTGI